MCNLNDDAQLMLYLEGSLDPAVMTRLAAHIRDCADCRARLSRLEAAHDRFRAAAPNAFCPDDVRLGEYWLDTLDSRLAARVSEHVATCAACRSRLSALGRYLDPQARPRHILYPAFVGRTPAVAARRSEGGGVVGGDELTFIIHEAEINLALRDGGAFGRTILGLVTGIDLDTAPVAALRPANVGAPAVVTPIGPLGDFAFEAVAPGRYELIVRIATLDYILRDIVI